MSLCVSLPPWASLTWGSEFEAPKLASLPPWVFVSRGSKVLTLLFDPNKLTDGWAVVRPQGPWTLSRYPLTASEAAETVGIFDPLPGGPCQVVRWGEGPAHVPTPDVSAWPLTAAWVARHLDWEIPALYRAGYLASPRSAALIAQMILVAPWEIKLCSL